MLKLVYRRGSRMSIFDKPTSPESKIIQFLHEMIEESVIKEDELYIEDIDLTIKTQLAQLKNGIAQVVFILKHELFQEEIVETIAGGGPTSDEAMKSAAIGFVDSAFSVIQEAIKSEKGHAVIVKIAEKENHFKLYQGQVKVQGSKKQDIPMDYWALLGDEMIKRIGNKRVYFIKVYVAKTDSEIMCECRINGVVYPYLTGMLKQVASEWEIETKLYAEKQCFVLIQDESTYKPYPLTKKEVDQLVLSSLLLYRQCNNQADYDSLKEKIIKMCNLPSLAEELFSLIPEMFTEVIFNEVTYFDNIVLDKAGESIALSKHQLTAYDWIYSMVERTIRAGYFEKEQVDRIISCSASLNCINQALRDGSKLENLCTGGIAIPVDEDYEIL